MTCDNCDSTGAVVWIGTVLLCGFCYLAWAMDLVAEKRPTSYLDCVQKKKRVERKSA
jgi:hypothetical protein